MSAYPEVSYASTTIACVNWRGWRIVAGLALLGSALVAQAVAAPTSNPEAPRCHGQLATIVGTDGDDVLHGTPGRDVIWGGRGDDRFRVIGSLRGVGEVRVAGGPGDDVLRGGGEDSLLEGGLGADRLYGGAGSDALIAGRAGGPNFLHGGPGGSLLAAGPPCAGGRIVGGSGSDNVSFAELPIQPGVLVASLRRGIAYVEGVRDCNPVRIARSVENLEGSFGPDVLVGDRRANNILGQPGADRIYGGGGDDFIDARDGGRDAQIQCGARGSGRGLAMIDRGDPAPRNCGRVQVGKPIPGLPK